MGDDPSSEPVRSPPAARRRYSATVAYDGAPYHGFAPNPGVTTVGGELARALERALGERVAITCAGRTDAGVHAVGQIVSFDAAADADIDAVQLAVNRMCGPTVVMHDLRAAAPDFDARFSARSRTYRYRLLNRALPDPFLRATTWHVRGPLDLGAIRQAATHLVGTHDFSSFCRKRTVVKDGESVAADLTRTVISTNWCRRGDAEHEGVVEHWITANAFCQQMVRSITGTLVDVGRGRIRPDAMPEILAARDRHAAGTVAPPHGLTLWRVDY